VASNLHHEVAGEAVRALDDDRARPVGHQAIEHFRKARPVGDVVRAADRRIIERGDDLQTRCLGVSLERCELAFVAVLIDADVGAARCPELGDCFAGLYRQFIPAYPSDWDIPKSPPASSALRRVASRATPCAPSGSDRAHCGRVRLCLVPAIEVGLTPPSDAGWKLDLNGSFCAYAVRLLSDASSRLTYIAE
jgi:hypothetical protein